MARPRERLEQLKGAAPRNEWLRKLEGWYNLPPSPLYEMWEKSGSKLKFSRWLSTNGLTELAVKRIVDGSRPCSFKVSCRYHDVMRASSTRHFSSCLKDGGMREHDRAEIVKLSCVAVVWVGDSKGDFRFRSFLALREAGVWQKRLVMAIGRWYGARELGLPIYKRIGQRLREISDLPIYLYREAWDMDSNAGRLMDPERFEDGMSAQVWNELHKEFSSFSFIPDYEEF